MLPNFQFIDDRAPECPVCFGPHNDEIHDASVSIHCWFRSDVLRRLEQPPDMAALPF